MRISGFRKCSMVDYPGKVSAVLFTPGCNLNCYYCHNRHLLTDENEADTDLSTEAIFAALRRRRRFLDGVVISGGEPTLQPDLERFLVDLRELGFPVKLDTNGTRPDTLRELIDAGLVDYVAMDLKATPEKYDAVCGATVDQNAIEKSIEILLSGRVPYEFRTTMVPDLDLRDLRVMAKWIEGADLYALQQYRPLSTEWFGSRQRVSPPARDPKEIQQWAEEIQGHVRSLRLRGMGVETIAAPPKQPCSESALSAVSA